MSNIQKEIGYLHARCDYLLQSNQILQLTLSNYLGVLCNDLNEHSGSTYNNSVHQLYRNTREQLTNLDNQWRDVVIPEFKDLLDE